MSRLRTSAIQVNLMALGLASVDFVFLLRTSAIQASLMALGLASVGADEEVNGTAHGIKLQKVAEILSIL